VYCATTRVRLTVAKFIFDKKSPITRQYHPMVMEFTETAFTAENLCRLFG
jgi:hypothetical protein